jgi:hypothetical protein
MFSSSFGGSTGFKSTLTGNLRSNSLATLSSVKIDLMPSNFSLLSKYSLIGSLVCL